MALDLAALKTAMTDAGFEPSAGTNWLASDVPQYLQYVFLNFNMTPETAMVGLQYPGTLPEDFPGKEPAPPVRTLLSIALTGTATAVAGATSQLTATGTYSLAPLTEDVTATATWASSVPATATVAAGLVTGVATGSTDITATVGAVASAPVAFTVTAARALQSIAITGPATVVEGATINLVATGTYNIAPLTVDITSNVAWVSATPAAATVGAATGVVTGVAEGSSDITCSLDGFTAPAHVVTVTAV